MFFCNSVLTFETAVSVTLYFLCSQIATASLKDILFSFIYSACLHVLNQIKKKCKMKRTAPSRNRTALVLIVSCADRMTGLIHDQRVLKAFQFLNEVSYESRGKRECSTA